MEGVHGGEGVHRGLLGGPWGSIVVWGGVSMGGSMVGGSGGVYRGSIGVCRPPPPPAAILDERSGCGRGERLALALAREQVNGGSPPPARLELDVYELPRDSQYETTDTSEWGWGAGGRHWEGTGGHWGITGGSLGGTGRPLGSLGRTGGQWWVNNTRGCAHACTVHVRLCTRACVGTSATCAHVCRACGPVHRDTHGAVHNTRGPARACARP